MSIRLRRLSLAIVLLVAAVAMSTPGAGAAAKDSSKRQQEIDKQVRALRDEIDEASAEEADLLDRLQAARERRTEFDARVAAAESALGAAQGELNVAQAKFDAAKGELVRAQLKLTAIRESLGAARAKLRRQAVSAYLHRPDARSLDLVLQIRDAHDLAATKVYVRTVVDAQRRTVAQYLALRGEATEAAKQVEADVEQGRVEFDNLRARAGALQNARDTQDAVRDEAREVELQEKALYDEAHARRVEFEEKVAALRGESTALTQLILGNQRQDGSTPGQLSAPIPGAAITSTFGPRTHPIYGTVRVHTGIDFRGALGTPIHAAADGIVLFAGVRGGYGNAIVIDHGGHLSTLYGHQSQLFAARGDTVTRGQTIGLVGSTGLSTGPHLHFEVRLNGTPVNPLNYL